MDIARASKVAAAVVVAAGLSLTATACGDKEDGGEQAEVVTGRPADFAATPAYLRSVIDDSQGLPHRFEARMKFTPTGLGGSGDPLATGASDGTRTQMTMDMGEIYEQMFDQLGEDLPDELSDGDLSMETVVDETTVYMRAPMFAALEDIVSSSQLGAGADLMDIFAPLGDGWAKYDLAAATAVLPNAASGAGSQNMDPGVYLEIVAGADEVRELDGKEIDGVPVVGVGADVSLGDMMAAQGLDADAIYDSNPAAGRMTDLEFEVQVWMDNDANIRQMTMDMGEALAEQAGEDAGGFEMVITFDFFDYGADDIEIEVPTDAVDVTEDFVAYLEQVALH